MTRVWTRALFGLALGLGLVAGATAADDEKKTEEKVTSTPAAKGPDWSGYVRVSQVTAEVVKADDSSVTLRLYMLVPNGTGKGQRAPRPQLHRNTNPLNPLAMRRPSNGGRPQVHWDHHDYTVSYAPEGLARMQSLSAKTDEAGKKVPYTQKELEDLKAPLGAPGYAVAKTDLMPGSIVDVTLVRDKSVAADKMTEADLRIKYAIVTGTVPGAAKDATSDANHAKKKKN